MECKTFRLKLLPFLIALSAFPLRLMPEHSEQAVHELAQEWMPWALEDLGTGWSFFSAEVTAGVSAGREPEKMYSDEQCLWCWPRV